MVTVLVQNFDKLLESLYTDLIIRGRGSEELAHRWANYLKVGFLGAPGSDEPFEAMGGISFGQGHFDEEFYNCHVFPKKQDLIGHIRVAILGDLNSTFGLGAQVMTKQIMDEEDMERLNRRLVGDQAAHEYGLSARPTEITDMVTFRTSEQLYGHGRRLPDGASVSILVNILGGNDRDEEGHPVNALRFEFFDRSHPEHKERMREYMHFIARGIETAVDAVYDVKGRGSFQKKNHHYVLRSIEDFFVLKCGAPIEVADTQFGKELNFELPDFRIRPVVLNVDDIYDRVRSGSQAIIKPHLVLPGLFGFDDIYESLGDKLTSLIDEEESGLVISREGGQYKISLQLKTKLPFCEAASSIKYHIIRSTKHDVEEIKLEHYFPVQVETFVGRTDEKGGKHFGVQLVPRDAKKSREQHFRGPMNDKAQFKQKVAEACKAFCDYVQGMYVLKGRERLTSFAQVYFSEESVGPNREMITSFRGEPSKQEIGGATLVDIVDSRASVSLSNPTYLVKVGGSICDLYKDKPEVIENLLRELVEIHKDHQIVLVPGGGPAMDVVKDYRDGLISEERFQEAAKEALQAQAKYLVDIINRKIGGNARYFTEDELHDVNDDVLKEQIVVATHAPKYVSDKLGLPDSDSDTHTLAIAEYFGIPKAIFAKNTDGTYLKDPKRMPWQSDEDYAKEQEGNKYLPVVTASSFLNPDKGISRKGIDDGRDNHLIESSALEYFLSQPQSLEVVQVVDGKTPSAVSAAIKDTRTMKDHTRDYIDSHGQGIPGLAGSVIVRL